MAASSSHPGFKPQRFGRYLLLERIGSGGMAEVYRAVVRGTQGFQRIVVVKRILPEMSRDPRFVQMFVDEAKISALISHPNVVQVYEFGKQEDSHFLTMEYVHGRNLSAIMGKLAQLGRLPPPDVIAECARQACLGLHHAHTMVGSDGKPLSVIHRDVTPANIIVGFNGAVKVLDFGIARAAEEIKETRTQAGAVKGKVAYLAPEQITRLPTDHRSDIFALGIVLHECLTGQRLFRAENPLAAMKSILEMPIVPPSAINTEVPQQLDQITARALARKPEDRYQNAKEMAMDLESVLIEQRYFSQRLPNFLKELFSDEVTSTKDRILPSELAALQQSATVEDNVDDGGKAVDFDDGGGEKLDTEVTPLRIPHLDLNVTGAIPMTAPARVIKWLAHEQRRWWALGGTAGVLIAIVLMVALSGGKNTATTNQDQVETADGVETKAPPPFENTSAAKASRVQISVDSFPQGARILNTDGITLGTTPTTIEMPRSETTVDLRLELEDYRPISLRLIPDLDKPLFGRLERLPRPTGTIRRDPGPRPVRAVKKNPREKVRKPIVPLDPFAD